MDWPMEFNRDLAEALNRIALDSVADGRLPAGALIPGVRVLDLWSEGPNGAMLFWVSGETARNAVGKPELHDVIVTQFDGTWRPLGSASSTADPWDDLLAAVSPGLTRFGGSSAGTRDRHDERAWRSVRLTWATAGPEVAAIRLRDRDGGTRDRTPGRHGFVLLGITPEDPITYAYAIDHAGERLPGEPILL
jgi:hypothetical protein